MDQLSAGIRKRTLRIIFVAVLVCMAADVLFFVFYMKSNTLQSSVSKYLLTRIILPNTVNFVVYIISHAVNTLNASDRVKNTVCAFGLCTIGGCMGIFHGWFVPLWCAPAIAMVYCAVYHDSKLQNALLVYCILLTAAAAVYITGEHPERQSEYIQNAVVVAVMTTMFRAVGSIIDKYSDEIMAMTLAAYEKEREYQKLLSFDDLTQVYSRPYFVNRAKSILDGSVPVPAGNEITLAILDVDLFKSVNDNYGHENGDEVLRVLGEVLHKVIDKDMLAGRYGGEEFIIMLTGGSHKDNLAELEQLREEFGSNRYWFCDRSITFSCGTVKCAVGDDFDTMLEKADRALYTAKRNGRNRTVDHSAL